MCILSQTNAGGIMPRTLCIKYRLKCQRWGIYLCYTLMQITQPPMLVTKRLDISSEVNCVPWQAQIYQIHPFKGCKACANTISCDGADSRSKSPSSRAKPPSVKAPRGVHRNRRQGESSTQRHTIRECLKPHQQHQAPTQILP